MKSLDKASKLAAYALLNAVRLHKDSILLFNNGSYPSALQLSILAQEELGKATIFEDHIFQFMGRAEDIDAEIEGYLSDAFRSHHHKQSTFAYNSDDPHKYKLKKYPRFIKDAWDKKIENKKQTATYVGLTKKGGKLDINGRISIPTDHVKRPQIISYISKVNDFIIEQIEACNRDLGCLFESDYIHSVMTKKLVKELEKIWTIKSKDSKEKLHQFRKFKWEY